jgi:hypothetical protein
MDPIPKSVEGGVIVRNKNGSPTGSKEMHLLLQTAHLHTGIFVDNAMALIPRPKWTNDTMKRYFATTMKDALAHGLTSIHDAGTYPDHIQFFKRDSDHTFFWI